MTPQLQKAIEIAGRTGDRVIVVDSNNNNAYVVIGLDEYEKLTIKKEQNKALTDNDSIDSINRNIALWKNKETEEDLGGDNYEDFLAAEEDIDRSEEDKRNNWHIPKSRKVYALEGEEENQYLEDLPY